MGTGQMDQAGTAEALEGLRDLVGDQALDALRRGVPLQRWRRSSPHNWFVDATPGRDTLWHSDEYRTILPDLRMFDRAEGSPSSTKPDFLHQLGGNPGLTLYVLREEYRA